MFDRPEAQFTKSGYVRLLEPRFAVQRKPVAVSQHVLAFAKGDAFMKECFPHRIDVCAQLHIGKRDEVKDYFVLPHQLYALGESPNLIVILYGSQESST